MKGVGVRDVEHKWGAEDVKLPGSVVDCDVAAGHDAVTKEHERLNCLSDGLRRGGLAVDRVIARALRTDGLR
jgi:hypothetical protein